jgi:TPR repeat protein
VIYAQALAWYRRAEHGNGQAQENIGYMFQHGTGARTDYVEAMSWFNKAAAQGNSDVENQLGWMYQFGQGVETDKCQRFDLVWLGSQQRNVQSKNNLRIFTDDLQDSGGGEWQSATSAVSDAVIAQGQPRTEAPHLRDELAQIESQNQSSVGGPAP